MTFLVIESFKNSDPRPVYARFAQKGRPASDRIRYVSSWVTEDLSKCYRVMEGDGDALNEWIDNWKDLVDFEIIKGVSSYQAAQIVAKMN